MKIVKTSYLIQQEGKKEIQHFGTGNFLRFPNYRIPLRICCPITKVQAIVRRRWGNKRNKGLRGHKISAKKRAGSLRGRELFSKLVPANARPETGLTSGWRPEEQRRRVVGRGRTDARVSFIRAYMRSQRFYCFKTFIIGERRSVALMRSRKAALANFSMGS